MKSSIIGELIPDPYTAAWRNSKNVQSKQAIATPLFDNQAIKYYLDFDGNEALTIESADAALANFFGIEAVLKEVIAIKAFENWVDFNQAVGLLDGIEVFRANENRPAWMEYSLKNALWLAKLLEPSQVWEYITPTEIIISKDRWNRSEETFVQILCDCAWEEEHGLQIILKNGEELLRVSNQDGALF